MYKFTAINNIKILLEDCCVQIICTECGKEVWLDSQNGVEECECGALYKVNTTVYKVDEVN